MTIFFAILFTLCISMIECMDSTKNTFGPVCSKDRKISGHIVLEQSSDFSGTKITFHRYELNEDNSLNYQKVSWNRYLKLPFAQEPFLNEEGNLCFYGYSSSYNKHVAPVIQYSLSKNGLAVIHKCRIVFNVTFDDEPSKNIFASCLGCIDDEFLLKAILSSPSVEDEDLKVYPSMCVTWPEEYEWCVRQAKIIFLKTKPFLPYAPRKVREYIIQAIYHQTVYNRLKKLAEANI